MMKSRINGYEALLNEISDTYSRGQRKAVRSINEQLIETNWQIGRHIVEYEQNGDARAQYGKALVMTLAKDLQHRHGRGFSRSNLTRCRQFYLAYSNGATVSHKLTWSHIIELLKLEDPMERDFYLNQSTAENWSVRELVRQKKSQLFLRLASAQDKAGVMRLATEGQVLEEPADLLREPYVLEFLKISEDYGLSETELEKAICDNIEKFLLELGKGFTFVGRQHRITINGRHHKVDLVFYHRILRCFVLIDLKLGDVEHYDIGQMNLYLGYFAHEEQTDTDNAPIGIILARGKDELLVEYATYGMSSQLFVQEYQLYLPDRDTLRRELERALQRVSNRER